MSTNKMRKIHIQVKNNYFRNSSTITFSIDGVEDSDAELHYYPNTDKFNYVNYIESIDEELPDYKNYTEEQIFQKDLVKNYSLSTSEIRKIQLTCTPNTINILNSFKGGYVIEK